jgi:2-iminobutanoate/2-iminopropanoate deaminase
MSTGQPLANYLAFRRIGAMVYASGVIAVDSAHAQVVSRYDQLSEAARSDLRALGYDTGQISVDAFESPAAVQSWWVLQRIADIGREAGARPEQTARLVQYFRDLRDYPIYNRVRSLFYPQGVVSTVVEVSRMLPNEAVVIEVEATWDCS